jgi:hypothetical protein
MCVQTKKGHESSNKVSYSAVTFILYKLNRKITNFNYIKCILQYNLWKYRFFSDEVTFKIILKLKSYTFVQATPIWLIRLIN